MTAKQFTIPKETLETLSLPKIYGITLGFKDFLTTAEPDAAIDIALDVYKSIIDEVASRTPKGERDALFMWLILLDFDGRCIQNDKGLEQIIKSTQKILGVQI